VQTSTNSEVVLLLPKEQRTDLKTLEDGVSKENLDDVVTVIADKPQMVP